MLKRDYKLYITDIKESIARIEEYTRDFSFENFKDDHKTIDAVIRNFEIIGEAAANLPEEFTEKYSEIPWGKIIGMRNKVVHEYFGVDPAIIWKTLQEDIPRLKEMLNAAGLN